MSRLEPVAAESNLFVYGTLLFDEVVSALTDRTFPTRPATLRGFARHAIVHHGHQAPYPAILPDATRRITGRLLMEVDPASMRLIEIFESDPPDYKSVPVVVECPGGERLRATSYVALPSLYPYLAGDWSMETFRQKNLADYVTRVIPQLRRELHL